MSKKGSQWERSFCRQLSEWFSGGKSDDWFWRSATSGARATTRAKKGKRTIGHTGDIAATCPEGCILTDFMTVELKRGYNTATPLDLFDCGGSTFEKMLGQTLDAATRALTPEWLLVHRRDTREPMAYISRRLYGLLINREEKHGPDVIWFPGLRRGNVRMSVIGMTLDDFFLWVRPHWLRSVALQHKEKR